MANLRKLAAQQKAAKAQEQQKKQQAVERKAAVQREGQQAIANAVEKHGSAGHHEHVLHYAAEALNNAATQLRMKEYGETRSQRASRPITEIDHHLHQAQLCLDEHRAAKRQGDISTAAKWMRKSANHIIQGSRAIRNLSGQPRFTEQTAGRGDAMHSHEHLERVVDGLANHYSTKIAGFRGADVLSDHPMARMKPRDPYPMPQDPKPGLARDRMARGPYSRPEPPERTETHALSGAQLEKYTNLVQERRGQSNV